MSKNCGSLQHFTANPMNTVFAWIEMIIFFPKNVIWEIGAYLKIIRWVRCTLHQYVHEHLRLWGMFVLCWVKCDISLKQMRNSEHRKLSLCHDYLNHNVMFVWLHKHFCCCEVNEWPPFILDATLSELFPWGWEEEVAYCTNCNGVGEKNNASPEFQFDSESVFGCGESCCDPSLRVYSIGINCGGI